jgi:hypothetical protein
MGDCFGRSGLICKFIFTIRSKLTIYAIFERKIYGFWAKSINIFKIGVHY